MHYEMLKHTGEYPIIGVNTFRNPHGDSMPEHIELARSTDDEKQGQLTRLRDFHERHAAEFASVLKRLQQAVIENTNVFQVLMGRRAGVLAGSNQCGPLRGGRAVSAQHVEDNAVARDTIRQDEEDTACWNRPSGERSASRGGRAGGPGAAGTQRAHASFAPGRPATERSSRNRCGCPAGALALLPRGGHRQP